MKNSKKLLGAVAALVIALAVSVGSTFAWFTTNQKVAVDNIQATVTTGSSDLQIRLIGKDGNPIGDGQWSYGITFGANDFSHVLLNALTTTDGKTFTGKPTISKEGTVGSTTVTGVPSYKDTTKQGEDSKYELEQNKGANYIELYFELRSTSAAEIVLDTTSAVDGTAKGDSNVIAWKDDDSSYGTAITKGTAIAANAKDAVRVSFLEVGASEETLKGIWNPNPATGYYNGNLAKDYELEQDRLYNGGKNATAIGTIYTANEIYTNSPLTAGTTVLTKLVAESVSGDQTPAFYYAKVGVKIWIEGTDGDCFNNIFDDTILAKIIFAIKEA